MSNLKILLDLPESKKVEMFDKMIVEHIDKIDKEIEYELNPKPHLSKGLRYEANNRSR